MISPRGVKSGVVMTELDQLDGFNLTMHGDDRELEMWSLLSDRFPSYERLWKRFIVPLTRRVDSSAHLDQWIQLRPEVPPRYELVAMASYSVFYFLTRAVTRFIDDDSPRIEHPEDILFLLQSAVYNFEVFRKGLVIASDCGRSVFDGPASDFAEMSAYRNAFLHNPLIIRRINADSSYVPKWERGRSSPLERAKGSWRRGAELSDHEWIDTRALVERLVSQTCSTLDAAWQGAVDFVRTDAFQRKVTSVTGLRKYLPISPAPGSIFTTDSSQPSGSFSVALGSNATQMIPSARGGIWPNHPE